MVSQNCRQPKRQVFLFFVEMDDKLSSLSRLSPPPTHTHTHTLSASAPSLSLCYLIAKEECINNKKRCFEYAPPRGLNSTEKCLCGWKKKSRRREDEGRNSRPEWLTTGFWTTFARRAANAEEVWMKDMPGVEPKISTTLWCTANGKGYHCFRSQQSQPRLASRQAPAALQPMRGKQPQAMRPIWWWTVHV